MTSKETLKVASTELLGAVLDSGDREAVEDVQRELVSRVSNKEAAFGLLDYHVAAFKRNANCKNYNELLAIVHLVQGLQNNFRPRDDAPDRDPLLEASGFYEDSELGKAIEEHADTRSPQR